jgi:tetratricopeptide (TPR) repeat protein
MEAAVFLSELGRDDELLAYAVLGEGLPVEVEHRLREAGRAYAQDEVAERHLHEARRLAPDHAAVLIAFYRYYFYKGRLEDALEMARTCLAKAAVDMGLVPRLVGSWREVTRDDAAFDTYDAVLPRFYLFTLKGYAYLQMRLGNLTEGRDAAMKLLELDPNNKLGAKVLLDVLEQIGKSEEE